MIRLVMKYVLHTVILLLLQVFVMNNIAFFNMFRPFIYVLVILMLPTGVPRLAILFIGFGIGLFIDAFTLTYGVHASAALTVAFSRSYILAYLMRDAEPEESYIPLSRFIGLRKFVIYTFIALFIHQVVFHFMQNFGFGNIFFFLFKTIMISVISLLFIVFYDLLAIQNKLN